MRAKLTGAAALVLFSVLALPALAQSREDTREARRHMEIGQEYFLQERWEDAATEFLAAHELRAHPAFIHNAAMAFHNLGAASRAIELYRQYLEEAPDAPDRADVEERIRLLERAAATGARVVETPPCEGEDCPPPCPEGEECPGPGGGEPAVRIERVELDPEAARAGRAAQLQSVILVEAEPAEAEIQLLNDAGVEIARGPAPLEHTAEAGRYTLVLQHPEYREVRTPVQVQSGRFYVFHIEMSQPPAFLQVIASVPGSTVYMDDRSVGPVGTTPWGDVVRTGAHTLWIERPGYETVERQVEIELGQEQEVEIELERLPFGMARVHANIEGATVEIDGEVVGVAPIEGHQLAPGDHQLRVRARGMKDWTTEFPISRGQTTRILVRMNPSPSRTSAWVSLGFSAVVFAASGVLGWYSTVVFRDLEDLAESGRLATDDNRMVGGFLFALGADVGFAVGAAIAGLTLYYFLRDPLPPSEGRVDEPVDFTENPVLPAAGAAPPAAEPAAPSGEEAALRRGHGSARSAFEAAAGAFELSPFGFRLRF